MRTLSESPCIYEHILIKHSRVESFTLHYVSHPNSCDTKSRGTITIIGDGEAFNADRFFVQTIKACHLFNCFFSGCRYPFFTKQIILSSSAGLAEKDKVFIHKKQRIFLIYFKFVIILYVILYISSLFLRAFLFF